MSAARRSATTTQPRPMDLARVARQLTGTDRWLLRMIHEHGVLTTTHAARLGLGSSLRTTQARMAALHRAQVLDRFQPAIERGTLPLHYVLGPLGAKVLAAEVGVETVALGYRRERALATAHRLSLAHDIAMIDLACDLVTAPGLHVDDWWSPARCRRLLGRRIRPDAYLSLTTTRPGQAPGPGGRSGDAVARARVWEMFVEYDTGTTALSVLAAKLRGYGALAAATGTVVPVAVWVARPGREPGARRALAAARRVLPDPRLVPVLTATTPPDISIDTDIRTGTGAGAGEVVGAQSRVWLPLHQPPGMPLGRYRLADLATPRPGPTLGASTGHYPDGEQPVTGARRGRGRVELPAPSPYPPRPGGSPGRRRELPGPAPGRDRS